jgi:hypothetical protein
MTRVGSDGVNPTKDRHPYGPSVSEMRTVTTWLEFFGMFLSAEA